VEELPERDLVSISAKIHVESESQKGILIGQGGKMIKKIVSVFSLSMRLLRKSSSGIRRIPLL
jgi:GTPase Era involved in 16S rRNA processing